MHGAVALQQESRQTREHLGDEGVALPALDLGQVWIGPPVYDNLVEHLVQLLRRVVALVLAHDSALQPHAQRNVDPPHLQETRTSTLLHCANIF